MALNTFVKIFRKVGGWQILQQYARGGVLLFALVQTALLGLSRKGLEIVRQAANYKFLKKLRRKNRRFISDFVATAQPKPQEHSNKVWVCWLQGLETAPPVVQRCFRSLQENLPDREIILLTRENYGQYAQFPSYVTEKLEKGIMTFTHFSDLLRLELLLNHGGTWIDATVLCTSKLPSYMLDAPLFLPQALKPGADGQAFMMSSWFMTSCTNHPILELTRALLYRYWEKKNYLADYFLLHHFFQLAIEAYPELWAKVMPVCCETPHIILLRMFEPFDQTVWDATCAQTPIHKLSYKFTPEEAALPGTYYTHILGRDDV